MSITLYEILREKKSFLKYALQARQLVKEKPTIKNSFYCTPSATWRHEEESLLGGCLCKVSDM